MLVGSPHHVGGSRRRPDAIASLSTVKWSKHMMSDSRRFASRALTLPNEISLNASHFKITLVNIPTSLARESRACELAPLVWYAAHCISPDQIPTCMHCIACVERYSRRLWKAKGPHEMDIGVFLRVVYQCLPLRLPGRGSHERVYSVCFVTLEFFCHTLCR